MANDAVIIKDKSREFVIIVIGENFKHTVNTKALTHVDAFVKGIYGNNIDLTNVDHIIITSNVNCQSLETLDNISNVIMNKEQVDKAIKLASEISEGEEIQ